jgi:predicted DNA-binding transcriptional regulator AlpA
MINIDLQGLGDDALIKSRDVAAVCGVSQQTLRAWSRAGVGPKLVRIGKRLTGCKARDLRAYLNSRQPV